MDCIFHGYDSHGNNFLYVRTTLNNFSDITSAIAKMQAENPSCVRVTVDIALNPRRRG